MSLASGSAAKNMIVPIITDAIRIKIIEQEKILFAVFSSFFPRAMEIGTDAPTPTRSAIEKLIITIGIAILTAANATSPNFCPIKIPSKMLYIDIANILTMPGNATVKNNLHGESVENIVLESIFIFCLFLRIPTLNIFQNTRYERLYFFPRCIDAKMIARCLAPLFISEHFSV